MEEWIRQVLISDQAGFTVLIAVFLLGLIGVFTCGCNFSIIGIVAGYSGTVSSSGKTKPVVWNGIFFLTGMIVSMSVIGGIIGYASELISDSFGNYWKIAAGMVSIFFGLFSMDLLPFKMPGIYINPVNRKRGIFSSMIFGITIGGLTLASSSCCNPVFPIILAVSFVKSSFIWGLLMLFAYSLGYGLTFAAIIVGIGIGLGKTSKTFSIFGTIVKYAGGIVMIAIGFYLLVTVY
jgi:cytochrome c biogenesis protein CcdA